MTEETKSVPTRSSLERCYARLTLLQNNFFIWLFPHLRTATDYSKIIQLKRTFWLASICAVLTASNTLVCYESMTVELIAIHFCFIAFLCLSLLLLRHPNKVQLGAWLLFICTSAVALGTGAMEGPAMLAVRALTVVPLGRVTAGWVGTMSSGVVCLGLLAVMAPGAATAEQAMGVYAHNFGAFKSTCLVTVGWIGLWMLVSSIGEEAMREKLVSESEYKNVFLAKMSHEMRTPLVGIVGAWELLEENISDESKAFVRSVTPVMRSCLDNIQRLIEDVLDISKMSKGLIELELAVCNVHDVIRPVLQLFSSRANARGISVEYDTDAPEPLYIETDRVRLNQIVVNLVSNSLKFSDDGKIVIRTSLQGDPTESTRMLTLSVSDDGIGLHGEDFERLFRLFEQGSAGLKRGGTGLGLAICHQIVVLLGGSITAHPKESGKGVVFEVSLPVTIRPPPTAQPKPNFSPRLDKICPSKVLLAEDNEASQKIMTLMLRRIGAEVVSALDGVEATTLLESTKFDLLLLDLEMPRMSGWGVVDHMLNKRVDIPIVVLTAHALNSETKQKLLHKGVREVAHKPLSLPAMQRIVCQYTQRTIKHRDSHADGKDAKSSDEKPSESSTHEDGFAKNTS